MSDLELAWAAGFFDGEGCTSPNGRSVQLSVSQNDPQLLERFQQAVGCGVIQRRRELRSRTGWHHWWRAWSVTDVRAVLDKLWPYLGPPKKRQALRARALVAMSRSIWPRGKHPHNPMIRDATAMGQKSKRTSKYVGLSCADEPCERQPVSRGMCNKHYLRWYKARRREEA